MYNTTNKGNLKLYRKPKKENNIFNNMDIQ